MDTKLIKFKYDNFSSLSPSERKEYKEFINSQLVPKAQDLKFGAKVYCVLHGLREPEVCEECKSNYKNWQPTNETYGKFCSRACTDIASKYGSNYEKFVRTLDTSIDILDYYLINLKDTSLVKLHMREPEFYSGLCKLTDWLPYNAPVGQRIWHLLNSTSISCMECGASVEWNPNRNEYNTYCSAKCSNASEVKKEKTKKVVELRYGVSTVLQLPQTQLGLDEYRQANPAKPITYSVAGPNWKMEHDANHIMQIPEYASIVGHTRRTNLYGNDVVEMLDDCDTLVRLHHNEKKSLTEIGILLGVPNYTVSKQFKKLGIEVKNYYKSVEEDEVADYISSIGFQVERNIRNIISGELDIVIPDKKIAIEYCGLYWHSDIYKHKSYHFDKWKQCEKVGIRLITIFQNEWKSNKELVKRKLLHILGGNSDKVYARNTVPVKLDDVSIVRKFLDDNHIQGFSGGKFYYGLMYGDVLVAVMVLQQENNMLNLVRYASSLSVVGGFSKLLKYFRKNVSILPIKTFADMRWDTGKIYEDTGFELTEHIRPDYYYIKNDNLFHKFNFRHKQLSKLPGYDSALSESQNTANMNIHKIYDCGKKRFILR